jgi:indolepyruvate ferredoxin oxidoreductase beta subunit
MNATRAASPDMYDIYFAGVGGQGVLTIGEVILEAAYRKSLPVSFYPTKGMAQRGGFVKAQLRLGRASSGAAISEKGADLVIATEVSEALKTMCFIKPGGDFILFGYVWQPTAVMLGKAPYPSLDTVLDAARHALGSSGSVHYIPPASLPELDGVTVPDNIFTLGVAMGRTRLGKLLNIDEVEQILQTRWKRGVERNLLAFRSGLALPEVRMAPVDH